MAIVQLIERLRKAIGSDAVVTGNEARRFGFDGFEPVAVAKPASAQQAAEVIKAAAAAGVPVVPRGGATELVSVHNPARPALLISTEKLNRITAHAPRDLTVAVQAGMTLAALNSHLAEHSQRLPLDPARPREATMGGICASNRSGPTRLAYGTPRDWVIGMRMILPDGAAIKSGGQVVKNVAGYDLHRLYIGSFGSLGLITEVTLRLRPRPEARRLVSLNCDSATTAETWVGQILRGPTRPVMIGLLNHRAAARLKMDCPVGGMALILGYEESRRAVDWQLDQIVTHFGNNTTVHEQVESEALYSCLQDWPGASTDRCGEGSNDVPAVAFRATVLSSTTAAFMDEYRAEPIEMLAHAGNGVIYGRSAAELPDKLLEGLIDRAVAAGGNVRFSALPSGSTCPRWGRPRADAFLMEAVKRKFDPAETFMGVPSSAAS